tara:strand:+ start:2412 stop:2876 length:465 start_codon:yes stop_codon:yes gene_type:complete
MGNIISMFLGVLLIFLYFMESNYSKNIRSYDLIIPWNQIFPERSSYFKEIEELSDWLNQRTSRDSVILSNIDYIRALSERSVLGSNAMPLTKDKLKTWLDNKLLYENFLENTKNKRVIEALQKKGINYIIIKKNIMSKFPTVYSSDTYKIVKVI